MNIIQATVIYALPEIQHIREVKIKLGSTVKDAILASNLFNLINNISFYHNRIGIYNKIVHLKSKIKDGDRIEIYRNLMIDPREWRRKNIFRSNKNFKIY
ncbi:RnfH family protein [Buchnera aphidicola]|uniref:RnfH family protein n=1 Tax=Buchnera aphidicola TaxID=9 RepID=UPI0010C2AFE9|nr:RnfH family protein [Buchnera aphidicola]QCO70811.1 RnfH family protein [Buchnera aphidicola (Macrosiphum euphorbiae)]